ncbi:MAG: response regulator transcription factor [Clostridia bacterium]|nr:response regulator transcription factor [Clostridia bacterium]
MIKIAIVDDELKERNKIKECLDFVARKERVEFQVSEFSSGLSFIGNYRPIYDIVLMDIEMPEADGLEIAHMLREMDKTVIIIFVTNMAKYAVRGYEVEALDFVVKPINIFSFAMKMGRAVARTAKRFEDSILIKMDGEMLTLQIASIKYLEVDGHYVIYHTTEGNFNECITLKHAEDKIGKTSIFVRCNRGHLVNLCYVTSIKALSVFLGDEELSISRPQKLEFVSAYLKFVAGGRK